MKEYYVKLPITGIIIVDGIEAESEEEAIEKAMQSDITMDMVEEWDVHKIVCQGNVYHGISNEAEAVEE